MGLISFLNMKPFVKMSSSSAVLLTLQFFLISINLIVISATNIDDGQLIFAQTLCRHGDRNIYPAYPNDPFKSMNFWPGGYRELTNLGKQQHFQLGKYFRWRYSKLLGNGDYSADKVYVQSTDIDRTLMSAQATLAGQFPPSFDQKWSGISDWQPIPVHTIPLGLDHILAGTRICYRHDYVTLEYFKENNNYEELFKHFRPMFRYIEENSGIKISKLTDLALLYDTLRVEKSKFRYLPEWADKLMVPDGDFERLALFWFQLHTTTTEMKKLKSGFLLKEILERFINKTQSTLSPDRSLWMYFAHDITIISTLNSIGLYQSHFPVYSSCILFELYETDDTPYVQIFYKNSTDMQNISALEIQNCGIKCPLHKLYDLYKDILPSESFEIECALNDGEFLPEGGNPERIPF